MPDLEMVEPAGEMAAEPPHGVGFHGGMRLAPDARNIKNGEDLAAKGTVILYNIEATGGSAPLPRRRGAPLRTSRSTG
jgi:hypothetical protein